ncbi:uncharacterized protein LOC129952611 isoform X3 [Eupeodes corollae]|uniref:uncharacterized protein LOC129952611 isoform X3 n=1 Tax=Eupeodes corollae TaxID=290404 RepID=UPI0024908B29|nr:uncharacterized protein LOC129952611 isoform X3 [Eupeodes corollae]
MAAMVNMNSLLNGKDSRWLQLEVCREFQRNKCSRQDTECKFAHPPANVEVQNGKVTACYDSIKGRCNRDKPPCKYFHPPQHLKDQLLINGRNHLALKNALMQQMGIAPGQPVMAGQVPTVATNPYLTGIPANTYSPYFGPGHLVPTILGPDPSAVASQLGPVVSQAVPVTQQKIPRSDRLEVCREFMRSACKRAESECRFAHPQDSVTTHEDGSVTVCMDAVKGRCARDPCRYFHPPLHLQAQIKAAQSRATAMDVKTVGSFYYENFAFSGMVPFKRPAGEKSGIPVYQPGATTYQQLMQLQQPFVPVSCEYQSQNPSATTAIPQPQTSTTANPIIANNNTNNHSMINNNNFILNNLNHLKNNNKISQVNLNTVHNSMASNGMLSINNLNNNAVIVPSSTNTIAIAATKISNSNNNNVYSLNNNNIGSNNSGSPLVNNNLTNKTLLDSISTGSTPTTQIQSSSHNTLTPSYSSSSPSVSTVAVLTTADSALTNPANVSASLSSSSSSISTQMLISAPQLNTDIQIASGDETEDFKEEVHSENTTNTTSSSNDTVANDSASIITPSLPSSMISSNPTTTHNITTTTTFQGSPETQLKTSLLKYEQANSNLGITSTTSSADVLFSAPSTPSISYSTSTQSRLYTAPHSYANVMVSHHGYTPVSSSATSAVPIAYSTAPSAYNYTSYPTQSYASQPYQAQCYPTNSYYADAATIAKEVAQKNYANAVKMAAASNALSGKPLTAAINYTGLPLNKTYVAQNPGAAVAFNHHQQQQHAVAAAAAQAAQVAGLRISSHNVGSTLGTVPVSTPSLLPRPPTGYLPASQMMRAQPMSMATAATTNPYAAAAAAAANQQYLQQQQQHFFYPGMMAGYPYPIAASGVPGLTTTGGMPAMPTQMQAAQMAQMNQAAAAAAQANAQGSAVVLNPYKKMKTS